MGMGKIGTVIGKEVIAWTRTSASKSLLATKPVKVNTIGLKLAPKLEGDVIQISKRFSVPSENEIKNILARHSITGNSFSGGNILLDKPFINANNSIFLKELDMMFPAVKGQKSTYLEDILVCLEDINHSNFPNKKDFLTNFIKDLERINGMSTANGKKLFAGDRFLYSKKAILQAKYNNPQRYKELMDLYKLVQEGKAPSYIMQSLIPEAHFHSLAKSDINKLLQGKTYFEQFAEKVNHDEILHKTELGDVFSIGEKMFVRNKDRYEELKMTKSVYEKLFPSVERYSLAQTEQSCYFVAPLDGMIKNPETRIDLYKMFEQIDNNKVKITLPNGGENIIYDLSDIAKFNITEGKEGYLKGALGYKMLEDACAKKIYGISAKNKNCSPMLFINGGGDPITSMRTLYPVDKVIELPHGDKAKSKLEIFKSSGNTTMVRTAMHVSGEDVENYNRGIIGAHCYSTQRGNIFNPWNSIEEMPFDKFYKSPNPFIYQVCTLI